MRLFAYGSAAAAAAGASVDSGRYHSGPKPAIFLAASLKGGCDTKQQKQKQQIVASTSATITARQDCCMKEDNSAW
jgi:hypothetical protein